MQELGLPVAVLLVVRCYAEGLMTQTGYASHEGSANPTCYLAKSSTA